MEFNYQELLKKAKEVLPKVQASHERFEIPKVTGHLEGNKTLMTNFFAVCDQLHVEPEKFLKYLQRELAAPATLQGNRLVFGRKLHSSFINQKIEQYAKDFVLCKECGKPDTQLMKQERIYFLKCTACGAKHPIKGKMI